MDQEELNYLSKWINPTKYIKLTHYTTILWGGIHGNIW